MTFWILLTLNLVQRCLELFFVNISLPCNTFKSRAPAQLSHVINLYIAAQFSVLFRQNCIILSPQITVKMSSAPAFTLHPSLYLMPWFHLKPGSVKLHRCPGWMMRLRLWGESAKGLNAGGKRINSKCPFKCLVYWCSHPPTVEDAKRKHFADIIISNHYRLWCSSPTQLYLLFFLWYYSSPWFWWLCGLCTSWHNFCVWCSGL